MTPYFNDGQITIYCEDAFNVLPALDPVDHVITDPPYENEAHTKGRRVKRSDGKPPQDKWAWKDRKGTPRYETLPFPAITEAERWASAAAFGKLARRWALVFCQAEGAHKWEHCLCSCGLTRRRWCVWVKPGSQPQFSGDRPGVGYETIVACHAKGKSHWNGGGSVGVFIHAANNRRGHVTAKPEGLMLDLVGLFTDPGDLILDPFMGGGTTLLAAKRLGRRAIGIERDPDWCAFAVDRLRQGALGLDMPEPAQEGLALESFVQNA